MRPLPRAPALVASLLSIAAAGCPKTETQDRYVYDPFVGEAYPDRLPKLNLPRGEVALVTNSLSDTVSFIDLSAGKLLGSAPVGRDPVDVDGPHHVAADRGAGVAFVALSYPPQTIGLGPHAAHGSSARAGYVQKLSLDDFRILGEVRVDPNPGDIVLSEDGSRIAVTHFDLQKAQSDAGDRRSSIFSIDPKQILFAGSPDPVKIPVCLAPHGVALSRPDGRTAYVACYGEDALGIVDLGNPSAQPELVPLPGAGNPGQPLHGPYSAVLSPSGKLVAVGCTESKELHLFDTQTRAFTNVAVRAQGAPYFAAWSPDETKLYVPTQSPDGVVVVDVATGQAGDRVAFTPDVCKAPHELSMGSDPQRLFLVCEGDRKSNGSALELDRATLATKQRWEMGVYPDKFLVLGAAR
jgi:DNA-binding beta-propeller fold protein YncE